MSLADRRPTGPRVFKVLLYSFVMALPDFLALRSAILLSALVSAQPPIPIPFPFPVMVCA